MVLVDTTFLLDVMKESPGALRKAEELEESSEEIRIPTPVIFELWEGMQRSARPTTERERTMRLLASFLEVPFDSRHAREAGRKSGQLIAKGEMLDPIDVLIAGTAIAEGEPLVTRDDDFDRIPELRVEGYT